MGNKHNNDIEYFEIGGIAYRVCLENLDSVINFISDKENEFITDTETTKVFDEHNKIRESSMTENKSKRGQEIDMPKYDLMRYFIEIIMNFNEEIDEAIGFKNATKTMPIGFKIAFNTLVSYGIIEEIKMF